MVPSILMSGALTWRASPPRLLRPVENNVRPYATISLAKSRIVWSTWKSRLAVDTQPLPGGHVWVKNEVIGLRPVDWKVLRVILWDWARLTVDGERLLSDLAATRLQPEARGIEISTGWRNCWQTYVIGSFRVNR